MDSLFKILEEKNIELPGNIIELLEGCKGFTVFNSTNDLMDAATNGKDNVEFNVEYEVAGKGTVLEAVLRRVKNGLSANYIEPYMRRRDPDTMSIADDQPTDKPLFKDKYGYDFSKIQGETFDWMKKQELGVFFYFAGRVSIGSLGIAIVPANAAFFAMGLSMLQEIVPVPNLKQNARLNSSIFVAPVFRHTHFDGKQVVVHNRTTHVHEIYAYNLYPGPSAKKGLYGVLLDQGEKEEWVTAHCSVVQSVSPYDNITTFIF